MIRLSPPQLNGKLQFIQDYIRAHNAADGSRLDANANVTQKNIATMKPASSPTASPSRCIPFCWTG